MWTRSQLEKLHEQRLTRDARSLNLKMSASPISRNRPASSRQSELRLTAAQWKNLLDNRDQPEYGAILKHAASEAGLTPSEKNAEGARTPAPAADQTELKKKLILAEARLMGVRKFTGGQSADVQAAAAEVEALKAQIASA